jgi:hypothetical protein
VVEGSVVRPYLLSTRPIIRRKFVRETLIL